MATELKEKKKKRLLVLTLIYITMHKSIHMNWMTETHSLQVGVDLLSLTPQVQRLEKNLSEYCNRGFHYRELLPSFRLSRDLENFLGKCEVFEFESFPRS